MIDNLSARTTNGYTYLFHFLDNRLQIYNVIFKIFFGLVTAHQSVLEVLPFLQYTPANKVTATGSYRTSMKFEPRNGRRYSLHGAFVEKPFEHGDFDHHLFLTVLHELRHLESVFCTRNHTEENQGDPSDR